MKKVSLENLNFEGNISLFQNPNIKFLGIVGSRSLLNYSSEVLVDLFENHLKGKNICIVSGGMYGADILAHNLALRFNLNTIIVLPCGISSYKNSVLFSLIKEKSSLTEKCLLISQYPSDFSARNYTFIERNKLVVGLSDVLLVAQSAKESGSIFSGNYALKMKKPVIAVPFSLDKIQFQGNNFLISQGAEIYLSGEKLLQRLGFENSSKDLTDEILNNIKPGGVSIDFLKQDLNGSDIQLIEKNLLKLVLEGKVIFDGERYSRSD